MADSMTSLPIDAAAVIRRFLHQVDTLLPARIEGFYLTGSLSLHDYHPGRSDVDFVAVAGHPLAPAELDTLAHIHAVIRKGQKRPGLDGVYVTWEQLANDPAPLSAPYHNDGHFGRADGFAANIVTWHTIRQSCVAVRGSTVPDIWHDEAALRDWCRANLRSYWAGWVRAARQRPIQRLYCLTQTAVTWGVLGVTRLHATILHGDILAKSAAGSYALENFPPRWAPIVREALAIRRGAPAGRLANPWARRRAMLAYMEFVMADALGEG